MVDTGWHRRPVETLCSAAEEHRWLSQTPVYVPFPWSATDDEAFLSLPTLRLIQGLAR